MAGKGSNRRVEDTKAIDARWPRCEHGCTYRRSMDQVFPRICVKCGHPEDTVLADRVALPEEDTQAAGEIIVNYDEHRELQRLARIAQHTSRVFPSIYALMEKEATAAC